MVFGLAVESEFEAAFREPIPYETPSGILATMSKRFADIQSGPLTW